MASAKLIGGEFTGTNGPAGTSDAVLNVNIPESNISNVGYGVYCRMPTFTTWLTQFGVQRSVYDMTYVVGRTDTTNDIVNFGGFLSPYDVMSLDIKYDDGLANKGNMGTHYGVANHNSIGCTTGTDPNYSYGTDPSAKCNILYWVRNF